MAGGKEQCLVFSTNGLAKKVLQIFLGDNKVITQKNLSRALISAGKWTGKQELRDKSYRKGTQERSVEEDVAHFLEKGSSFSAYPFSFLLSVFSSLMTILTISLLISPKCLQFQHEIQTPVTTG